MIQITVTASSKLVDGCGVEVEVDSPGKIVAFLGLLKKCFD